MHLLPSIRQLRKPTAYRSKEESQVRKPRKPPKPTKPTKPTPHLTTRHYHTLYLADFEHCRTLRELKNVFLEKLSSWGELESMMDWGVLIEDEEDYVHLIETQLCEDPHYEKNLKKYERDLISYEKKLEAHKVKLQKYNEDLEVWKKESQQREYDKLKKQLEKLEEKLEK